MNKPKKLYKICTQTDFYEQYEIEADSYEKAIDSVMDTINYGEDTYPQNVERIWYEYGFKQVLENSNDHVGLFAVESSDPDNDDLVDTECLGFWRQPTIEEYAEHEAEKNG